MNSTNVINSISLWATIISTSTIPVPCPEGLPGCCVLHCQNVEDKHEVMIAKPSENVAWDGENNFQKEEVISLVHRNGSDEKIVGILFKDKLYEALDAETDSIHRKNHWHNPRVPLFSVQLDCNHHLKERNYR